MVKMTKTVLWEDFGTIKNSAIGISAARGSAARGLGVCVT